MKDPVSNMPTAPSPKIVALTGGIGSGKSLVAKLFESWGAAIVDADLLAREVVIPGSIGLKKLGAAFPDDHLILADGSLNRSKLGAIIFSDAKKKSLVESILHPLIRELWLNRLSDLKKSAVPIIVYVIPLYFESSHHMDEIERIILVTAPEETRITRVMHRDGFTRDMVQLRIHAQLPDSEKIPKSDFVIVNDSSIDDATDQAKQVFAKISGHF